MYHQVIAGIVYATKGTVVIQKLVHFVNVNVYCIWHKILRVLLLYFILLDTIRYYRYPVLLYYNFNHRKYKYQLQKLPCTTLSCHIHDQGFGQDYT